jgi:hypothetical protein
MDYVIINGTGLFFVQMGMNDYFFTPDIDQATRFFAIENAYLKIRKLTALSGLKVKKIKQ